MNSALHELNTEFAWSPTEGPYRSITPDQAESYDEKGFFLLERAVDPPTISSLIAAFDPLEEEMTELLNQLGGTAFIARADEITFTTHLVTRSEAARDFVRSALFCDLTHDLLGPDVRLYWDQAVYKKPGTDDPFPWHQDNGYTFIEPQQYLTCWVALTDAPVEMGCPWVVPGQHLRGTLAHDLTDLGYVCLADWPDDAVPVPAHAGDIVVFSSLTPHATGPNTSDATRKAYIVQFAVDGTEIITNDAGGGESTRTPAAAPDRQFEILHGGAPPPLP